MDASILARIQFAANITFHILFPTITIALGWILLFFKLRYDYSSDVKWLNAYRFWVKIFALCFALGVVSGVTMSMQFGTNWPGFMNIACNIAGPLLAYEILTAFFLEATFLGIMLFGVNRISNRLHTISTLIVCIGTVISAFWILALNSWMQTPTGFEMIEGKIYPVDWMEIIFNPSMLYRFSHMLIASGLTAAFLIAGVSAYKRLKDNRYPDVMASMKTGIYLAAILIPIQIIVGDLHGLNTLKHQPAKIAAMEGLWETTYGADLVLFAIPDKETRTNLFEVSIPKLASFILTRDLDGKVQGLNDFIDNHPPVAPVFFAFRIMVGMGILMLITSWSAAYMLYRKKDIGKWMLRLMVAMTFSGWVATLAGWYVTEIGRQPWLVSGVLKTSDAIAQNVTSKMIGFSLFMYITIYVALTIAFISVLFYMASKAGTIIKEQAKEEV